MTRPVRLQSRVHFICTTLNCNNIICFCCNRGLDNNKVAPKLAENNTWNENRYVFFIGSSRQSGEKYDNLSRDKWFVNEQIILIITLPKCEYNAVLEHSSFYPWHWADVLSIGTQKTLQITTLLNNDYDLFRGAYTMAVQVFTAKIWYDIIAINWTNYARNSYCRLLLTILIINIPNWKLRNANRHEVFFIRSSRRPDGKYLMDYIVILYSSAVYENFIVIVFFSQIIILYNIHHIYTYTQQPKKYIIWDYNSVPEHYLSFYPWHWADVSYQYSTQKTVP